MSPEEPSVPVLEHIAEATQAHRRLFDAIASLTDEQVRAPSLLPGWSVGHVLAHLAQNAESLERVCRAAIRGLTIDQYKGGPAMRAANIESGATRSGSALIDDVRSSSLTLEDTWHELGDSAWRGSWRNVTGLERVLSELPLVRWREVELHLVDLGIGFTHAAWTDQFVEVWLPRTRELMKEHLSSDSDRHFATRADELAWLYGRLQRTDLPALPPYS